MRLIDNAMWWLALAGVMACAFGAAYYTLWFVPLGAINAWLALSWQPSEQ